jgi:hypothetical protein
MKTTQIKTEINGRIPTSFLRVCLNGCRAIRERIQNVKDQIFRQHRELLKGQERLLRLALNEAEAIAWQTDYPFLVFPELAAEKAATTVTWQRRQKVIQRNGELAFAA